MKLKCRPEDFRVEELTDFACGPGPYALYRLGKQSLGTPEAIDAVLRRWRLPRADVSYGGLKDKHAQTQQYLTVRGGPRRNLTQTNLELTYLGQAERPYGPHDIRANRFHVVLRDLKAPDLERATAALAEVQRDGVPNYFDDQRFGSLGRSGEFIVKPWCLGDYERALWLALADANEHDRPGDRREKQRLRDQWGRWDQLKGELERSHRRSIVSYLADHPQDFRGAFARLRVDLRSLYLAAFQSFLWNRILAALLREQCPAEQIVNVPLGPDTMAFFRSLPEEKRATLAALELPLPSARQHLEDGPIKMLCDRVLAELGLEMRLLRVKYPRDSFFSRGGRAALFSAANLSGAAADDDLYPGRHLLQVAFDLPRGCYATVLVKRLPLGEPAPCQ